MPSFGALIDGEGQVTDFIRLVNLTKSRHSWRAVDREGRVKSILFQNNFM